MRFRSLRADEVELRAQSVKQNGLVLLIYKDARCDQNILDETVGPMNWEKSYQLIDGQLFCTIRIWDEAKQMWVSKQDVGVESNTEAEKGRASDAQKRAAFAFGIGRELYTAPFIWIPAEKCNIQQRGQGFTCYDRFKVTHMKVEEGRITALTVVNESRKGAVVFSYGSVKTAPKAVEGVDDGQKVEKVDAAKVGAIMSLVARKGVSAKSLLQAYKVGSFEEMSLVQWMDAMARLDKYADKESK